MPIPCYIGDETSAAGFRLAGVRVIVPPAGGEAEALASARADASLVLISADVAARISPRDLVRAHAALAPLTLIVPDLRGEMEMPDLATRLRAQLGLEDAR
jgi:vacuolar-type H+-ATPase subunit F/Vma7